MFRNMTRKQDYICDYCPQMAAANLIPNGTIIHAKRFLPNHAQDIVRYHRKLHHEAVRRKFPGWKPLYIHVGLELAVILLAFPMGMIKLDDLAIWEASIIPVHVHVNLTGQEELPMLIGCAFGDFIYNADVPGTFCPLRVYP